MDGPESSTLSPGHPQGQLATVSTQSIVLGWEKVVSYTEQQDNGREWTLSQHTSPPTPIPQMTTQGNQPSRCLVFQ